MKTTNEMKKHLANTGMFNLKVEKEDIFLIGHTQFNDNGFLYIACYENNSNLEKIFLRNILKCFGNYKIVDTYEIFENENDLSSITDIVFKTDLPYTIYSSIS